MENQKKNHQLMIVFLLFTCLLAACQHITGSNPLADPSVFSFDSLTQLSNYPLYEFHYIGDYGFASFLESGNRSVFQEAPTQTSFACSSFAALGDPENKIFGRNFDWYEHPAMVLHTDPPDGYASISLVDLHYLGYDSENTPLDNPEALRRAPWLPFDGMNENGLVISMMAVDHADGIGQANKIILEDLEVIRLVLDYAKNVSEAIDLLKQYNVLFEEVPIHYLIADAEGNSVIVEYLNGEPVFIPNQQNWQVSTNFLLTEEQPQADKSSCWRYNTIYSYLEPQQGIIDAAAAMDLLANVSQGGSNGTRWSAVYDSGRLTLDLAVNRNFEEIFSIKLRN
ncbi:MAG: choloylglycine hydrolase [Chloroflexi bacterium HGW-Chloroflexi-10]|nr:MAG: choloylglycine hydrolase [Chloroflexi bacterium HGW-Chloroflexi-10]